MVERRTTTLQFLGGAGTVTGSKFLLEHDGRRVLVDCGLFQGRKELRLRNWAPLGIDPASIDAVVLTHAHVDHCGYLPKLCVDGFDGPVFATAGTADLAAIVLPDAGHLQEEDADYANRRGFSKHRPALPLYTEADARATLGQLRTVPYGRSFVAAAGIEVELRPAGHILGSAIATVRFDGGSTVTFSGDLGRRSHPLLGPPADPPDSDWIVVESTYGDRLHDEAAATEQLGEVIRRTVRRGGKVLIPAFAVDRTEVILLHLARLARAGELAEVPVFVDSPMALAGLGVYRRAVAARSPEIRPELAGDADLFDVPGLVEVHDVAGSKALNTAPFPAVVISASGMGTGGRVVHHLAHHLPDHRNSVVLVGYQADGTRGRSLLDGVRQLKMLGRYVRVRADVVDLAAFSVHADRDELLDWLAAVPRPPDTAFVVHGEPTGAAALQEAIVEGLDWTAAVPRLGERVRLDAPVRPC
ncbi:MAG: MBL fold metallo-hydrolase [Acidimicrobiia bacterium]|nr:MBL fold metallo-hydrolase [Acidimicrobiia bacterium]